MFKAAVHSCVSCHNLLCLTCCSTWRRIKGEAFVTVSFCVLFDCVLVSVLLDSRASWAGLIKGDRVPISVVQRRWEVRMRRGFFCSREITCVLWGIRYLLETARRLQYQIRILFSFICWLEGFLLHNGLPCPSPIWAALLAAPLWGFHLHVTGIRSYFQIHYRSLTAVGNQFEESIINVYLKMCHLSFNMFQT